MDFEVFREWGEVVTAGFEIVVGEPCALAEEDFGLAPADAIINDGVAEIKQHGFDHGVLPYLVHANVTHVDSKSNQRGQQRQGVNGSRGS